MPSVFLQEQGFLSSSRPSRSIPTRSPAPTATAAPRSPTPPQTPLVRLIRAPTLRAFKPMTESSHTVCRASRKYSYLLSFFLMLRPQTLMFLIVILGPLLELRLPVVIIRRSSVRVSFCGQQISRLATNSQQDLVQGFSWAILTHEFLFRIEIKIEIYSLFFHSGDSQVYQ